jgi:hypothetical protein
MSYNFTNRDLSMERERHTACPWCHQVLALAGSCASSIVVMGDKTFDRIRYGNETFFNEPESPELSLAPDPRCPDCNVVVGGWHHGDCAREQCVQCGGPLAECDCDVQEETREIAFHRLDEGDWGIQDFDIALWTQCKAAYFGDQAGAEVVQNRIDATCRETPGRPDVLSFAYGGRYWVAAVGVDTPDLRGLWRRVDEALRQGHRDRLPLEVLPSLYLGDAGIVCDDNQIELIGFSHFLRSNGLATFLQSTP